MAHVLFASQDNGMTFQAGLLAFGSIYFLHLPILFGGKTVAYADFVPDYSGGTAPDLNGIPYYAQCT